MLNNVSISVEHIIAKFDNDFNVDNSDWIPRVGAWVIDAMSQLNVLRKVRKEVKLNVCDRIASSICPINSPNLIVKDSKGCVIDLKKSSTSCGCDSSTGEVTKLARRTPQTIDIINNGGANYVPDHSMAETINTRDVKNRHVVHDYDRSQSNRDYVMVNDNQIELNFDARYITVETDWVETVYSKTYNCEIPVIPNVGILIEAIVNYCMYKMLCRGYKHPVFNLAASQYGTNPYYEWTKLKPEVKRAVTIDAQGNINVKDGNAFRGGFLMSTLTT